MNSVKRLNARSFACYSFITILIMLLALVLGGSTKSSVLSRQAYKTPGYCAAELDGKVVYATSIYDTKLNLAVHFSSQVIAREFTEYPRSWWNGKRSGIPRPSLM